MKHAQTGDGARVAFSFRGTHMQGPTKPRWDHGVWRRNFEINGRGGVRVGGDCLRETMEMSCMSWSSSATVVSNRGRASTAFPGEALSYGVQLMRSPTR
jgi:hypothetical protein